MRRKEKSARERESETTVSARAKKLTLSNPFEFRTIDVDFQCGYAKLLIL